MCTVDIGVMGQIWVQEQEADTVRPFVDFNTLHVCRDFEEIRSWAEAHQVGVDLPEDFIQPPSEGAKIYSSIP